MTAGVLDQQIFFQSPVETDYHGELQTTWVPADDDSPGPSVEWANVITQRGSEAFESARVNAVEAIRVKIRFRDDITTQWRFRWEDQFYYVTAVDRSQRRAGWLWLTGQVQGAQ